MIGINVGSVRYYVIEKPVIEIDDDKNYQGCCDYRKTEISILNELSDERKDDVLIHELTHAIFYEAGFEEQDEDMINRVAKVLHQVIKNNDWESIL